MKKQYVIIGGTIVLLLIGSHLSYAQQTISSGGGDLTTSNVKLAFTIGEIAVKTHTNTNFVIKEGTQHVTTSIVSTVIEENKSIINVDVYPNPATNYLVLTVTSNDPLFTGSNWMLFDVTGKQLASANGLQKGTHRLDLPDLTNGIYFLKVW